MRLLWVIPIVVVVFLGAYRVGALLHPTVDGSGQQPTQVAARTGKRPPARQVATKAPAADATVSPLRSTELMLLLTSSLGLCLVFAGMCLRTDLGTTRLIAAALALAILGCVEILEMST